MDIVVSGGTKPLHPDQIFYKGSHILIQRYIARYIELGYLS